MLPARADRLSKLLLRWLARGLCTAGAPSLVLGCAQSSAELDAYGPPRPLPVRSVAAPAATAGEVVQVGHVEAAPAAHPAPAKQVPINLDTVLRLAEQHNARVALYRERVHESQLTAELAASAWLPKTYAGIGYYRHEGGIQNEDGTLQHSSFGALFPGLQICSELDVRQATFQCVDNERKVWQAKGESSQVTYEVLLEAATTYVDLLTARRGEAVGHELAGYERKLLEEAERNAKVNESARSQVEAMRAILAAREYALAELREKGNAASAKLVYLLGLPPCTWLVPVEAAFVPLDLVDATPPCCDLAAQALSNGPGVQEMEAMLAVMHRGLDQSGGLSNLIPTLQLCVGEGAFGAGPGANLAWDNRFDLGLQVRWDLTLLCTAAKRRAVIESKVQQAHFNYDDLRGKLAAGVQEARDTICAGRERIGHATQEIRNASEAYRLSDLRLRKGVGGSITDVLANVRELEQGHFHFLSSIAAYNKAQVRLMLLLGPGPAKGAHPPPAPAAQQMLPAPRPGH
jgi:outer membrane protein TolC